LECGDGAGVVSEAWGKARGFNSSLQWDQNQPIGKTAYKNFEGASHDALWIIPAEEMDCVELFRISIFRFGGVYMFTAFFLHLMYNFCIIFENRYIFFDIFFKAILNTKTMVTQHSRNKPKANIPLWLQDRIAVTI
jgi:hypothetical protein